MDPNETLKSIRHSLEHGAGSELVDDAEALDGWIMKGGFLPREWAENCNGGLLARAELAKRVYEEAERKFFGCQITGSGPLHTAIGVFVGSILCGEKYVLAKHPPSFRNEFLELFGDDHPARVHYILEEDQKGD